MGGGGGILSSVTNLLFGKVKTPSTPAVEAPAPPAPTAKVDTGAIIQTGAQDTANDRLSKSTAGSAGAQARASTLGSLRANKGW